MNPSRTFLGLDGGGTHVRAWLVTENGALLGSAQGGPANVENIGVTAATQALLGVAGEAYQRAGLEPGCAEAAFAACAGLRAEAECKGFGERLRDAGLAAHVDCANDTEAALAGAFGGGPGIVLILGTGSFCLGRDAHGTSATCGGWGWVLDDVGGSSWLGRQAVRAVLLADDGRGRPTLLRDEVFRAFDAPDAAALAGAVNSSPSPCTALARLAPCVSHSARRGDEVALSILREAAEGAAHLVQQVVQRLAWDETPPLVLVGGAGRSGPPYTPLLEAAVALRSPYVRLVEPLLPPVAGAALRALQRGGIPPSTELIHRLSACIPSYATH